MKLRIPKYWRQSPVLLRVGLEAFITGKSADEVYKRLTERSFSATSNGKPPHLSNKIKSRVTPKRSVNK